MRKIIFVINIVPHVVIEYCVLVK